MIATHAATAALDSARRRHLDIPEAVTAATAARDAVNAACRLPEPDRPQLPDDPADIAEAIAAHATAHHHTERTRAAAADYMDEANDRFNRAVQAAAPAWAEALDKPFTSLIAALRKAAPKLPADTDPQRLDWDNPRIAAAWQAAEGAAVQLDQLVTDHQAITRAAGADGGRDRPLHAVATLPPLTAAAVAADHYRKAITPTITTWRDLRQRPVCRWIHLVRQEALTLGLATPAQFAERTALMQAWQDATVTHVSTGRLPASSTA